MINKKQKTILLVDDEVIITMAEKLALEKYNYKVITASTGEEAVATVEKTPAIDLVLMDINLGAGIDGTEAAAIILRQRDIPVVFLSIHTEPEVVEKTEKITSYGYVVKDSNITVLDASIKMAFKLFEASAALKETAASYHVLFYGASDGILLADSQTKQFHYANPAICRMLGYTEEEFLRISMADIYPKESLDKVLANFEALVRGEIVSTPDLPCLRKDGSLFYVNISHSEMVLEDRKYQVGFFRDITGRKQAEDALRKSEARYRELFDNMSSGVAVFEVVGNGNDFIFKDFNRAGERLDKTRKEDVIGESIHRVRPGIKKFGLLEVFKRVFVTGISECFLSKFYQDEKMQGWYDNFVYRLPSGEIVAVFDNIDERKQAEVSIKQVLAWQQMIFEGSRDAIFISDQDSRFVAVNNAACDLTGYSREQLLKMRIPDIHDRPDLDAYKMYHQRIFTGEEILSEAKILRSDGAKIDTEFNNRCVSIAGKLYMHTTARNITERKQAEEEIKRQLAEKETLLKEVHHRIKNNITSIGGLLSLHMQSITNPEAIEVLQDAIGRVSSMRILYDKLLITENYQDISVKNYVECLSDAVVALFPDRAKIKLEKQISDFYLDPKQLFPLGLIITELITNKMKYAFIDREAGLVTISLKNAAKHVTLTIQDNGNRLPAGFDMDKTKGFGLVLVKMLIQQLGGSFSMEKGVGTRCIVEFTIGSE